MDVLVAAVEAALPAAGFALADLPFAGVSSEASGLGQIGSMVGVEIVQDFRKLGPVLVSAALAGSGTRSAAMPAIATAAARGPGHAVCSCPTVATALPRSGDADAAVADARIIPNTLA